MIMLALCKLLLCNQIRYRFVHHSIHFGLYHPNPALESWDLQYGWFAASGCRRRTDRTAHRAQPQDDVLTYTRPKYPELGWTGRHAHMYICKHRAVFRWSNYVRRRLPHNS